MRGSFVLVLVSAVAAGSALLLWDDAPESPSPPAFEPAEPGDGVQAHRDPPPTPEPGGGGAADATPGRAEAVSAGVRKHLADGHPERAARAVLEAEAALLADPGFREVAFTTADALVRNADDVADAVAVDRRLAARSIYAAAYDCDECTEAEFDRAFAGARAMQEILVVGAAAPDKTVLRHKVQAGEALWTLSKGPWRAAGITVPPGFVLHVNGISDARRIRAGQTVRVPREQLSVLIRKRRFELTLMLGGAPFARFPVGIGADDSTPVGTFHIETKLENPDWYFGGRRIPFGDPENLIGTRWLGFAGAAKAEGIGIHGTTDVSSVGRAVSMGCVRMRRADVEALFDWLPYQASVDIR